MRRTLLVVITVLLCSAVAHAEVPAGMLSVTEFDEVFTWIAWQDNNSWLGGFNIEEPGIARMWYMDTSDMRDIWTWEHIAGEQMTGVAIEDYQTIIFRVKMLPGVHLNVDVNIDGHWSRIVPYYSHPVEEWIDIAVPLPSGQLLTALRVGMGEPEHNIDFGDDEVYVYFDWIRLSKKNTPGLQVNVVPQVVGELVTISGVTKDAWGNAVGGVLIEGPNYVSTVSAADGSFSLQVVPGEVLLQANKDRLNGTLAVTVGEGEVISNVEITLVDFWSITEFDNKLGWVVMDFTNAQCGFDVADGIGTFWYMDTPERDLAGYGIENQAFPAGYNQLAFRVKLTENAHLTTEIWPVNDWRQTVGITSYYTGTGDWEVITVPIAPEMTGFFRFQVSISEPGAQDHGGGRVEQYWDWIRLYRVDE